VIEVEDFGGEPEFGLAVDQGQPMLTGEALETIV
jgi:hypothetical protein